MLKTPDSAGSSGLLHQAQGQARGQLDQRSQQQAVSSLHPEPARPAARPARGKNSHPNEHKQPLPSARALTLVAGRSARCFCPAHPGRARSTPHLRTPGLNQVKPGHLPRAASLRRGGTTAPVRDKAGRAVSRFPPGSSRRRGRRSAGNPRQPKRKAAVARHSPPCQDPPRTCRASQVRPAQVRRAQPRPAPPPASC